jgi:hypothetical protein
MKPLSIPAIALASALSLISLPAIASYGHENDWHEAGHVAAPAPLIGASLPGLAIGYGVFWLIRRRARPQNKLRDDAGAKVV